MIRSGVRSDHTESSERTSEPDSYERTNVLTKNLSHPTAQILTLADAHEKSLWISRIWRHA